MKSSSGVQLVELTTRAGLSLLKLAMASGENEAEEVIRTDAEGWEVGRYGEARCVNGVESGLSDDVVEDGGGGNEVCAGKNEDEDGMEGCRAGKEEKRSCASEGDVGWKDVGGRSCRTAHCPLKSRC